MNRTDHAKGPRLFAPEVVQTSAMDCGPAALASLLEGFGIPASYPRLQEACSTDVDGTSINTLEQMATALGLEVEQIMLPIDHLLLDAAHALPALVVVRRDNMTHFLVAWRRHGPLVQVMDPAKGRRWLRDEALRDELYVHNYKVPADAWRAWAGSAEFLACLRERLHRIGIADDAADRLLTSAAHNPDWHSLAVLDASLRMATALVHARGLRRGQQAADVIDTIVRRVGEGADPASLVPVTHWSVLPDPETRGATLILRGAVLLRVRGRRDYAIGTGSTPETTHSGQVATIISERPRRPIAEIWQLLRQDGVLPTAILAGAVVLAAAGSLFEVMLLRGVLEIGNVLSLREHRLITIALVLAVMAGLLLLDVAITGGILRLGRRVESRLRVALLAKLPRLGDRYFRSRLVSDLAHRAHSLDALRMLPDLAGRFLRTSAQLLFTASALAWLDPASALIALLAAALALAIPLGAERLLAERELRQRSHAATLSRHYLDSLLGLMAARTHAAEHPLRQRHEAALVEWGRSSVHLLRGGVVIEGMQMLVGSIMAVWLVLAFAGRGSRPGSTLLLVYWALNLPILARELVAIARQYPAYRNILGRILEPLTAPDETPAAATDVGESSQSPVELRFDRVAVHAGGNQILDDITLAIPPGEHVAIVGRSGAGKSTLVGLLLGWHQPASGSVLVDGAPLDGARMVDLRAQTAWVDPAVHLWNRSLFDNLRYGESGPVVSSIGAVLETSELSDVLERLPSGLQSPLGEGGALTSGGEGQRVRFGRALVRAPVRLALLDEPFRGISRDRRKELLVRARDIWRDTTLLCVTHDIEDTLDFDRVIVIERGRIVEDGDPAALCDRPASAYAALLAAERSVKSELWSDGGWRRWHMRDGAVTEQVSQVDVTWNRHRASPGH